MNNLIDLSVKKPITVFMAVIAIMILGMISLSRLAVDLLPSMEIPVIMIRTEYEGAGPEEVEKSVTRVVETAIATVSDVDTITSSSQEGSSRVLIEFAWGADLDAATSDVREAIDRIRSILPDEAESPMIFKFSTDDIPVMGVSFYGSDNLAALYDLADNMVLGKIEQVPGVAQAEIRGGLKTEIMVDVDLNRLQAYGLSINDIVSTLAMENQNIAGGSAYEGVYKYILRTTGEFENLDDIRNVVVSISDRVPVRLRDVATVYEGYDEDSTIVRVNGAHAVSIEINKESGKNTVQVADAIEEELEKLALPIGINYDIIFNTADSIRASIDSVVSAAWQGGLFAVVILMIYLSNFRTVGIITFSIPISIIATFTLMYFMDITLNVISLSGLTLGIGMMVDNSIVVLENIFYYRQIGKGKYTAAIQGTADVALAISASTFTTIAVFLPFIFVEGITGEMFRDLCLTVTISLLTSLGTALTIVPTLSARMMSTEHNKHIKSFDEFTNKILTKIDNFYIIILKKAIKNKKKAIISTFAVVIVSLTVGLLLIGKEGFPTTDQGEFQISLRLPAGTRGEQTDSFVLRMEDDIRDVLGDKLERIQAIVKYRGVDHMANIRVKLTDLKTREPVDYYVEEVRQRLKGYPGRISIRETSSGGPGGGSADTGDVNIEIIGDDLERAEEIGNNIIASLEKIDSLRDIRFTREDANPEVRIKINRDLASKMGLNTYTVAKSIETAFAGSTATRITPEGSANTDIDVVVRLAEKDRQSINNVNSMMIPTPYGMVPVASIAEVSKDYGPSVIERKDNKRLLTVTVSIFGEALDKAMGKIKTAIANDVYIPSEVIINYSGSSEDMDEAFGQLLQALILAIVLVYAIMASQFESLIAPFVIALSLPFGIAGALLGLFIGGENLSVYGGVGIIMLVGIVINNGIVLIDYMNQLILGKHGKKMDPDVAAVEAGIRRMRPVMMTTLTTIFGLFPMALSGGEGSELFKPVALSVLGGLTVSTVFTLVVIPIIYSSIRNKFKLKSYEEKDKESIGSNLKHHDKKDIISMQE